MDIVYYLYKNGKEEKVMKKGLLILGGLVGIVVLVSMIFLAYIGMFSDFKAEMKDMGPYTFVYEKHVGPYSETKKVFDRVDKKLVKAGIRAERGFGIYYDNPADVAASKLRSECGSLIEGENIEKFKKVKDDFNVKIVPRSKSIVVAFPIKNAMSYMFGPMKCYPILNKVVKEKKLKVNHAAYELYDMKKKVTYFVMPVK